MFALRRSIIIEPRYTAPFLEL